MPAIRFNLPPITRALLLILVSLSTLNAALRFRKWSASLPTRTPSPSEAANYFTGPEWAIPYLVLIPTKAYKFPWTFFTAAVVENNFVSVTISAVVIWFGGRYLERAWGSKEFAKFLLFVTMVPNIFAFFVYALWHAVTSTPVHPTPIQGLVAVEAGFLVALKQLVPEHTVSLFRSLVRIRIKHFPAIFVLANMISGPLLGTDTAFWLSLTGFYTSWIYLRFFRITEITSAATGGDGAVMKGDASDTFSFVGFWPDAMHPFLSPLCDGIWNLLVQFKICTPFSEEDIEAGNESAAARTDGLPSIMNGGRGGGGGGGGRRAEAERRRALALKALDQRLNAAAASRHTSAPVTSVVPVVTDDAAEGAASEGVLDTEV